MPLAPLSEEEISPEERQGSRGELDPRGASPEAESEDGRGIC